MASNLQELRKSAGYKNANDFAEAHKIPPSTYSRYESSPNKIPLRAAWQLADALGTTIDAIVGREVPAPSATRGKVQLEYDGLTPEGRAIADEFREFVLMKDKRIRSRMQREEERPYDALCYQYECQMLADMGRDVAFGKLITFEDASAARAAFESYLRERSAEKREDAAIKVQKLSDEKIIGKIMAAYDRTHGEFEHKDMQVTWTSVDHGLTIQYDSEAGRKVDDTGYRGW